jgi:hypothetical protein
LGTVLVAVLDAVCVGVELAAGVGVLLTVGLLVGAAVRVEVEAGGGAKLSESPHAANPLTISRQAKT